MFIEGSFLHTRCRYAIRLQHSSYSKIVLGFETRSHTLGLGLARAFLQSIALSSLTQLGGRELSSHPYSPLLIFVPPAISPVIQKKISASLPGAGLPLWASSARISTRVTDAIPPAHHPVGAAQGRPNGWQLKPQAARPDADRHPPSPKPGAARPTCPGPALMTSSKEYPAHPQAAAPHAPMRHWPMRPLDPRPNTKESSLQSVSPMFGSAVQERAMVSVTHGRMRSSSLRVGGILSAQGQQRRAGQVEWASPDLHDVDFILWTRQIWPASCTVLSQAALQSQLSLSFITFQFSDVDAEKWENVRTYYVNCFSYFCQFCKRPC